MTSTQIDIEAIIDADVRKVWEFYNSPEHITQWNQADPSWHCPSAQNDLRVGGKLQSRMEAKDGSFGFDFEGTYNSIDEFKHIDYTIADGRNVSISFEDEGNSTKVSITFEAESINPIEMQKDGWQAILNSFKSYTESNA